MALLPATGFQKQSPAEDRQSHPILVSIRLFLRANNHLEAESADGNAGHLVNLGVLDEIGIGQVAADLFQDVHRPGVGDEAMDA